MSIKRYKGDVIVGNPNAASGGGWRDITGQIIVKGVGSSDPDWAAVGSGFYSAFKFAIDDECWISYHVPHDIEPETDIYIHSHWTSDDTSTDIVKWEFTYSHALGFGQEAFNASGETPVTAQQAATGTAYTHMVTESSSIYIPSLTEPDGLILVRCKRVTNGGTDNTDNIFLLQCDIHYESTNKATLNKSPNFYT